MSMHDTILTRGNLGYFEGDGWIENDVHMTSYPSLCIIDSTHGSLALKAYQQNLYLEYYY